MNERRSGAITMWAGILGAASGVFLAVVPSSVPDDRFSYPLAASGFIAIQLWFAVHHIGLLVGIQGLARFGVAAPSRLARIGHWFAGVGMFGLIVMEIVAITAANAFYPSARTDPIDAGYGIATIAIGVGLVLLGIGVLRERRWTGWQRWVPLALGVWVFVPMTPAIMGPFLLARLAITAWMLLFAALGVALMRSSQSMPTSASRSALSPTASR